MVVANVASSQSLKTLAEATKVANQDFEGILHENDRGFLA